MAQDTTYLSRPPLVIPKTTEAPILDGLSDEPLWQRVQSFPFVVLEPVYGAPPTEKTELLLTYDDAFLYVAGRCYTTDSSRIVARNLVRDGWRGDDWMTLHLDSRFDRQNAFVFSVYPLGSRYDMATGNDAVELGSSTFNPAFNMIWEAKTVVNKQGWFFEMKIPLYNLRFRPDADGNVYMGVSSTRAIQSKQEYHQFPAVPRNAIEPIMKPSLKQPVVLRELPRPRLFLLTPYLLAGRERRHLPDAAETAFIKDRKTNIQAGFDAKIGLSSYLTLDVSANPDFAQAEVDDQLINLTRFSLFFPERRLFFQEQAGLFEFNLGGSSQLFYSRRIGINDGQLTPIYGGVRLTGKLSPSLDVGALNMQSAPVNLENGLNVPSENFGVLRLRQRVLNSRSFVGTLLTTRTGAGTRNFTAGLDALLNPKGIHYVFVAAAQSVTDEPVRPPVAGLTASRLLLSWETRRIDRIHHKLSYSYSGRDFNPGVGFLDRSNFHSLSGNLAYGKIANNRKGRFQYMRWTLAGFETFVNAQSGRLESQLIQTGWRGTTFRGTQWSGSFLYTYEYLAQTLDFGAGLVIPAGTYSFPAVSLSFVPARFREIQVPVSLTEGRFFNGNRFNFAIRPTVNLGRHWEFQGTYDLSYLRFPESRLYQPIHIGRLRMAYALDLHLSANLTLQYNSLSRRMFANARLRYNFRDGHDLYLVLNENFYTERRYNEQLLRPLSDQQTWLLKYFYTFEGLGRKR